MSVYNITSIFLDTFYCLFSPLDIWNNFFQFGLLVFIVILVIGFFLKLFIKSI